MKLGLLGKSLGHSFSKGFFDAKFEQLGLTQHSYDNLEFDTAEDIKHFKASSSLGLNGFNVTIPYKETVFSLCDELSTEASDIGAVNCVKVVDGRWIGHNTDSLGFLKSIAPFLESQHSSALIFGTGGASKAIAHALESKGVKPFIVGRKSGDVLLKDIKPLHLQHCKLLVNCTPLGMFPNEDSFLQLPYESLTEESLVIDLVYNPEKTIMLEKADEQGSCIVNGKAMLHFQAEASWEIWL